MGDGGGGHWLVRMEWRPAGWSVCLPLLISLCTIKSISSLLAPVHRGGPGERAVKRLLCCCCSETITSCLIFCCWVTMKCIHQALLFSICILFHPENHFCIYLPTFSSPLSFCKKYAFFPALNASTNYHFFLSYEKQLVAAISIMLDKNTITS